MAVTGESPTPADDSSSSSLAACRKSPGALVATGESTLALLVREGGMRALKIWVHKLFCDRGGFHPVRSMLALKAEILWSHGDHEGVRQVATELAEKHRGTLGHFYLAQSAAVTGDLAAACDQLHRLLAIKPDHTDGIYLLARCNADLGRPEEAWKDLEALALRRKRVKTWQQLANLVETPAELRRVLDTHRKAVAKGLIPEFHREISNHLSVAAMRGGDHELAKSLWRDILAKALDRPAMFKARRPKVDVYSRGRAEKALSDLRAALGAASIEMFLISGTLLGCVREGRLLSHDKDIDVGIWDHVDPAALSAAIRASGRFQFIVSRSRHIVRVRHLNGIPLDLFIHYREPDDYWHASSKLVWHNSPFTLVPADFLGESYLVPADHDTYLRENYGDWRTPKTDFDSAFDTPNGEVTRKDELIVHTIRMLFASVSRGASNKIAYYLGKLEDLGERELVASFRRKHRATS